MLTAVYLASFYLSWHAAGQVRVLLVLFIAAVFGLVCHYNPDLAKDYWTFFWLISINLTFLSAKHLNLRLIKLSLREVLIGDPSAERKRMIARLEQSMEDETDPELRQAYAEAIVALHRDVPRR